MATGTTRRLVQQSTVSSIILRRPCLCAFRAWPAVPATAAQSPFSTSSRFQSHENPLGLPRSDAPPTMPRAQRGLPQKRHLKGVKKVLVVSSGKGGVGKSSVAVNLALSLATLENSSGTKLRVGLLDLDIFGPSIPKLMGLEGMGEPILTKDNQLTPLRAHGIPCMSMGFLLPNSSTLASDPDDPDADHGADTPVVWRGMMVMKAVQQLLFEVDWTAGTSGQELDILVIDTPPGTGDVTLSLGQLVKVDGSVIVSTPQNVALIDTRKGVAMFRKIGIPITGAVLNMSYFICPGSSTRHYIFGPSATFERVCAKLDLDVLAQIPIEPQVSAFGDQGKPVALQKSIRSIQLHREDGNETRGIDAPLSSLKMSRNQEAQHRDPEINSGNADTSIGEERRIGDREASFAQEPMKAQDGQPTDDGSKRLHDDENGSASKAFHHLATQVWSKLNRAS